MFALPEAQRPDLRVYDQAPVRVHSMALLDGPEDEVERAPAGEERRERSRPTLAQAPESGRAGGSWGDHREAEFNERMRQHFPDWHDSWCPLVLSFDERPVLFDVDDGARFDTGGARPCAATDWPTPATPWLVRDLDGSGTIDGGHELVGTSTRLVDGSYADGGFAALAALDDDGDGRITPADAAWSSLALWTDSNRNRRTDPGELVSLDEAGVLELVLEHVEAPQCDARGNCMIERSSFAWIDADGARRSGALIDVHLACHRAVD